MFKIAPDEDAGIDCFSDPKSTQLGVGPNIDLVDCGSGLCIGACRLLGVDNGAGSGLCIGACRLLGVDNADANGVGVEDANGVGAAAGDAVAVAVAVGVGFGVRVGAAAAAGFEIIRGIGRCWGQLVRGTWRCGLETRC